MIGIITTGILIVLFFFFGYITQAFKKLFGLITKILLRILSFFGIKIADKERSVRVSPDFKKTYKDIRIVKLSKKNIKQKSSIDWVNFVVLIIALTLVLVNFKVVSGNAISNWITGIANGMHINIDAISMNTFYTATLFSVISFSLSALMNRWKETKQQRKEHKESKLKQKAFSLVDSKELLDEAKKKDSERYKEFKK